MDIKDVDQILWRRLTWTDFRGMTGQFIQEGGHSQTFIYLPGPELVADFFGVELPENDEQAVEYKIQMVPHPDYPGSEGPITIHHNPASERWGGGWRITEQHGDRYELWKPEHGFPEADDFRDEDDYYRDSCPIIWFVRDTDGDFYARFLYPSNDEALEDFPPKIRRAWQGSKKGEIDIINLSSEENQTLDEEHEP